MKGRYLFNMAYFIGIILAGLFGSVYSIKCHHCMGVTDPGGCSQTVDCKDDEECFADLTIGDSNTVFYNSGCRKKQVCALLATSRRRNPLPVCEECCGFDGCNNKLCKEQKNETTPNCYSCNGVSFTTDCHNRTNCSADEICMTEEFIDSGFTRKYKMGCEKEKRCELLNNFGRRQVSTCIECCSKSGCNRHLCYASGPLVNTATTSSSTPPTSTSTAGATSTRGLTASTVCTDSPFATCDLVGVCSPVTDATMKFCPKYCGVCSEAATTATATTTGAAMLTITTPTTEAATTVTAGTPTTATTTGATTTSTTASTESTTGPTTQTISTKTGTTLTTQPTFNQTCTDSPNLNCSDLDTNGVLCSPVTLATVEYCPQYCNLCGKGLNLTTPTTTTTTTTTITATPTQTTTVPSTTQITTPSSTPTSTQTTTPSTTTTTMTTNTPSTTTATSTTPTTTQRTTTQGGGTPGVVCRDSGLVDCKELDEGSHICRQKTGLSQAYCKKYCGLCTTHATTKPCFDNAIVNCAELKKDVSICNHRAAASKYCPKSCNLC